MTTIDDEIRARIQSFVTELSTLVREAALESVRSAFGGGPVPASHSAPRPSSPSTGGKRSPEQIKATVAKVLGYIRANPNTKSEVIRDKLKLAKPVVQDAIDRLKAGKKIAMKGKKRGATYAVA